MFDRAHLRETVPDHDWEPKSSGQISKGGMTVEIIKKKERPRPNVPSHFNMADDWLQNGGVMITQLKWLSFWASVPRTWPSDAFEAPQTDHWVKLCFYGFVTYSITKSIHQFALYHACLAQNSVLLFAVSIAEHSRVGSQSQSIHIELLRDKKN